MNDWCCIICVCRQFFFLRKTIKKKKANGHYKKVMTGRRVNYALLTFIFFLFIYLFGNFVFKQFLYLYSKNNNNNNNSFSNMMVSTFNFIFSQTIVCIPYLLYVFLRPDPDLSTGKLDIYPDLENGKNNYREKISFIINHS